MPAPEQARVIAGRYRLESLLGEGGLAAVWRGRDLTLARSVAVKILYAFDERDNQALVDQFLFEARSNIRDRFFSVSPMYFGEAIDRSIRNTRLPLCLPSNDAVSVLPVPGGPQKRARWPSLVLTGLLPPGRNLSLPRIKSANSSTSTLAS